MATIDPKNRWQEPESSSVPEGGLPATKARQGRVGRRVLTVLVAALVLSFIVWIPVEIWGSHKAEQASPATTTETQSPTAPAKPAP
ncbi:hypothetical protein J5275_01325 [Rhizobium sp. L245/93]|nr:hypothetical protein [Rhizobium sp. L245/93]